MFLDEMAFCVQENKFVSCYDHITWNDKRLEGIATEDDKSETFVAQARTLLDTLEVRLILVDVLQFKPSRPAPSP
jgi:hypothetical protein